MNYTEKFSEYTNVELLRIIENHDDYQTEAVQTASTLLAGRQPSEEEIKIVKDEIEADRQAKLAKEKKKKHIEESVENTVQSIREIVNPVQDKGQIGEKTVKIISLIFGGLFLIQFYKELGMISFMFTDSSAAWDLSMVLYFLPLIVLPTAIALFYMRKKIGWIVLTIFTTYSAISAIGLFLMTINMEPSGFNFFDNIFSQTSPTIHILSFLFFAATIWAISKETVRSIFSINKLTMILTVTITALVVGLGLKSFFIG